MQPLRPIAWNIYWNRNTDDFMEIIGVTGGIGSGKSVVCRFLHILGYSVYDSDERAKVLMDSSASIKSALVAEFGADVCIDGVLDRRRLAEIVFADAMALNRLNAIVHPAVKSDFKEWCERRQGERAVFIESAILIEAGFSDVVDTIWLVTASEEIRVERIMSRNGCTRQEAMSRIHSQKSDAEKEKFASRIIHNSDKKPLIPQIFSALSVLS